MLVNLIGSHSESCEMHSCWAGMAGTPRVCVLLSEPPSDLSHWCIFHADIFSDVILYNINVKVSGTS